MRAQLSHADRSAYYTASLHLLRFVEARAPTQRRFGPDADAMWKGFAGGLETRDRIDVLIRDADAEWRGAFGARSTFDLRAVAEDDAFGAEWASLDPMDGEKIWRAVAQTERYSDFEQTLRAIAEIWELPLPACSVPKLSPSSKLVLGGAGAIAAAIREFQANDTLRWHEQVVIVADRPAERQLAVAATALLNDSGASRLRDSADRSPLPGYQALLSSDAEPDVRAAVEAIAKP